MFLGFCFFFFFLNNQKIFILVNSGIRVSNLRPKTFMGLKTGKESSKASESFQYIAQSYCLCKTCLATQLPTAISLSEWEVKRYRGNWWGFKKKAFNTHLSLTDWFWFTYSSSAAVPVNQKQVHLHKQGMLFCQKLTSSMPCIY